MSYAYWNEFIDEWGKLPPADYDRSNPGLRDIHGWTNPNNPPIVLNTNPNDFTLKYFPEPWWGNSGMEPLHAVVINLNPGHGGGAQNILPYKQPIGDLYGETNYQEFIKRCVNEYDSHKSTPIFGGVTSDWHYKRRAKKIFNCDFFNLNLGKLENYLGIELIPWHTSRFDTKMMHPYIECNGHNIFNYVLKFAANESHRIENGLRNVVLVRSSESTFESILKQISAASILKFSKGKKCVIGKSSSQEFNITGIPDVIFICIWGSSSRNNFPPDFCQLLAKTLIK